MNTPPPITQMEMNDTDIEFAERIAKRLGFTQTAYTSTSGWWGLFCLPDHAKMREGCIIKTKEFGFLFVSDLEDLQFHDLAEEERKQLSKRHAEQRRTQQAKSEKTIAKVLGTKNPNCDNDKCASETGEVRVLPTGGDGNAILCHTCFLHELRYRRERNQALSKDCQFKLPAWETLKIYAP